MIIALYPPILKADIVDGSAYDLLLKRHPHPAQHDKSLNTLFCETVEHLTKGSVEEPNKVYLSEVFIDAEGEQLQGDQLAWAMAKFMAQPVRPALYAPAGVFSQLYAHPAYRLYCGKYEDDAAFQADLAYLTSMIEAGMPEALPAWNAAIDGVTYDQIGPVMLGLINSFGV